MAPNPEASDTTGDASCTKAGTHGINTINTNDNLYGSS